MEKKTLTIIQETAEELLKHLKIDGKVALKVDETETIGVNIKTEETGILIGYHGETLSALQLILGIMIYKKIGHWLKIVVNVGDYREKQEESLKQMAEKAAERVKNTQEAIILAYLSAGERRIIHLALQENPDVSTESEGEGDNRRLIIKPKIKPTALPQEK